MRILDSQSVINKKKASQSDGLFKSIKSKEILDREVLRLMKYKDSVEPEKVKEVEAFFVLMKEMQVKKAELINDIEILEDKKKELMKPLIEESLESMEVGTSTKKKIINEKIDKLEKIESEITFRSLELADKERNVKNDRIALEKKEKTLKTKISNFNKFIKQHGK